MGKMKGRESGKMETMIFSSRWWHFISFTLFHLPNFPFPLLYALLYVPIFFNERFFLCWMVCIHVFLTSSLKYNSHRNSYFPKHTMHPALRHRTDTGSSEAPSCSFPDTAPPKGNHFSWLLIACFTLKHNFTWINSNSLCIQLNEQSKP